MATSTASEDGNAEKCYGFDQLSLHSFGSKLLIRWFHGIVFSLLPQFSRFRAWFFRLKSLLLCVYCSGFELTRNTRCLQECIFHRNSYTSCGDSTQLCSSCEACETKDTKRRIKLSFKNQLKVFTFFLLHLDPIMYKTRNHIWIYSSPSQFSAKSLIFFFFLGFWRKKYWCFRFVSWVHQNRTKHKPILNYLNGNGSKPDSCSSDPTCYMVVVFVC